MRSVRGSSKGWDRARTKKRKPKSKPFDELPEEKREAFLLDLVNKLKKQLEPVCWEMGMWFPDLLRKIANREIREAKRIATEAIKNA